MVGQNKCDSLQLHNRSKSIFLLHILPVVAPINTGHCLYGEAGRAANGNHGSWTNTVNGPDLYNLLRCGFVLYALWNWLKVDWLTGWLLTGWCVNWSLNTVVWCNVCVFAFALHHALPMDTNEATRMPCPLWTAWMSGRFKCLPTEIALPTPSYV